MEFYEVLKKRRTNREWTDKDVDLAVVKRILDAAIEKQLHLASGDNCSPPVKHKIHFNQMKVATKETNSYLTKSKIGQYAILPTSLSTGL